MGSNFYAFLCRPRNLSFSSHHSLPSTFLAFYFSLHSSVGGGIMDLRAVGFGLVTSLHFIHENGPEVMFLLWNSCFPCHEMAFYMDYLILSGHGSRTIPPLGEQTTGKRGIYGAGV